MTHDTLRNVRRTRRGFACSVLTRAIVRTMYHTTINISSNRTNVENGTFKTVSGLEARLHESAANGVNALRATKRLFDLQIILVQLHPTTGRDTPRLCDKSNECGWPKSKQFS